MKKQQSFQLKETISADQFNQNILFENNLNKLLRQKGENIKNIFDSSRHQRNKNIQQIQKQLYSERLLKQSNVTSKNIQLWDNLIFKAEEQKLPQYGYFPNIGLDIIPQKHYLNQRQYSQQIYPDKQLPNLQKGSVLNNMANIFNYRQNLQILLMMSILNLKEKNVNDIKLEKQSIKTYEKSAIERYWNRDKHKSQYKI